MSNWRSIVLALSFGLSLEALPRQEPVVSTIYDHPEPVAVPELLTARDGTRIATADGWERVRRREILDFFSRSVYGVRPVERPADLRFEPLEPDRTMPGGKAVRKSVRISFSGPRGSWGFRAFLFLPAKSSADRPVPVFLLMCNRDMEKFADVERKVKSDFFPVEMLIERGYGAAVFRNTELAPDDFHPHYRPDGTAEIQDPSFENGFYACWSPRRTDESWGAISVWAWGCSRVMDWLETVPGIDRRRVAVVGHSRGGKTVLWAGATDMRFALVCANDSGCCGAKLNHAAVSLSETIQQVNANNPHWFCRAFRRFNGRDAHLPYDQHWLAALVAPRLLCIGSATRDFGAGPWGEFLTARLASSVWRVCGREGLVENGPYAAGRSFSDGGVGYHLREGGHDLTRSDWEFYVSFADRHLK